MRRIHLFEFEDYRWFPATLRDCLTRMLLVVHRLLKTTDDLAPLVARALSESGATRIIDLCSGSGGPMIEVVARLRQHGRWSDLELELTDLYPSELTGDHEHSFVTYPRTPIDAAHVPADCVGLRTMVCSFHHMRPAVARRILQNAQQANQPILVYEISDNSFPPTSLFWLVLPVNFLFALFVSLQVRPTTWRQLVFTWLIPVLPLCFAWDGAVSNARTYSRSDIEQLLAGLSAADYRWEYDRIRSGLTSKLYLLGSPASK